MIEILTALIGTTGILAGTWLGAHLNRKSAYQTALQLAEIERRKYSQDRLWDAKKDAYSLTIARLNVLWKNVATMVEHAWGEGSDPERYFNDPIFNEHDILRWDSFRSLKSLVDDNTLIFSDNFLNLFKEWESHFFMYNEEEYPETIIKIHDDAIRRFHSQFIKLAKFEITPDSAIS